MEEERDGDSLNAPPLRIVLIIVTFMRIALKWVLLVLAAFEDEGGGEECW